MAEKGYRENGIIESIQGGKNYEKNYESEYMFSNCDDVGNECSTGKGKYI